MRKVIHPREPASMRLALLLALLSLTALGLLAQPPRTTEVRPHCTFPPQHKTPQP